MRLYFVPSKWLRSCKVHCWRCVVRVAGKAIWPALRITFHNHFNSPIDLLVQERKFIYARNGELGRVKALSSPVLILWIYGSKSRWTARLIRNLGPWMEGNHGRGKLFPHAVLDRPWILSRISPPDGIGGIPSMQVVHNAERPCLSNVFRVITY